MQQAIIYAFGLIAGYTNISVQYALYENYTLRAGIINLTDEQPSFPTRSYGDILGRQWFVGLKAKF